MKRISVDFGSQTTKIYMPGCGVVLMEATCIAVEKYEDDGELKFEPKAYGDKARALSGRAAANTQIINPVDKGVIVNEALATELLSYFPRILGIRQNVHLLLHPSAIFRYA